MQTSPDAVGITNVKVGILMIFAAVFCLTSMDAVIKFLSDSYSVMQLVCFRYFGQTILVFIIFWRHLGLLFKSKHPLLQIVRSICLFAGTLCFINGFVNVDLMSATAILQTSPLIIAVMAHFMLKERVGWQRVLGIVIGLIGTLIIIRPGTSVFSTYSFYSVGAAFFYAAFSILTRRLSHDEDIWSSFLFTTTAGSIISLMIVPINWQTPTMIDIPWFTLAAIFGATGHYLFLKAHFLAEATALAPFTYATLIFAAINGALFFGDIPHLITIVGTIIVAGSGLFVWYRELKHKITSVKSEISLSRYNE